MNSIQFANWHLCLIKWDAYSPLTPTPPRLGNRGQGLYLQVVAGTNSDRFGKQSFLSQVFWKKKNRVIPAIKPWTVRKCVFVQVSEGEGWGPGKQKSEGSLPRVWSMSEPLCTSNPQIVGLSELFLKQEEDKGQFVGVSSLLWPCPQAQVVVARFFRLGCRDLLCVSSVSFHPPSNINLST